jgi:hypothetical protein
MVMVMVMATMMIDGAMCDDFGGPGKRRKQKLQR